jgi:methionyl-tRNA formyltransferase
MRVLYLGYGEIGCRCLESLLRAGIQVTGVIPRSSDDGSETRSDSVYKLATENGINILAHKDVRAKPTPEPFTNLDYIISVQYDRILNENWLSIPKIDTLNLHFSLLPRLRGCYPTKWAIIEEKSTGVTLHSVDTGIDTGDILDLQEVTIGSDETDASLYGKLSLAALDLFNRNISNISNKSFPGRRSQVDENSSYHPKEMPLKGILDLENKLGFCERFLRAFTFPPYPPARCILNDKEVGLHKAVHKEKKSEPTQPGFFSLSKDKLLAIECLDGILYFDTLQVDGVQVSPTIFCKENLA